MAKNPSEYEPPIGEPISAIYTRQSRGRRSAVSSCEVQRGICEDTATAFSWLVCEDSFDDPGESSETLDRPALNRLLQEIESGKIQRVIVYSIDRLTRKLFDLHKQLAFFEEHDVELKVVTDPRFGESAASRLTTNVIASAAEFQQEITRERMIDSRKALKEKGRRVAGRVPFGYTTNAATKQLIINPQEAEVVRQIFEMAADGQRPREIAEFGNAENWTHGNERTGGWTARQILKLVSNPIYRGEIRDGDNTLPGSHEPIISAEIFEAVREQIEGRRSRKPGRSSSKVEWPLKGKIICGQCQRVMSPSVSGYGDVHYRYYRCRSLHGGRPPCKDVSLPAFEIEEYVRSTLSSGNWDNTNENNQEEADQFAEAWMGLDERIQRSMLQHIIDRVVFESERGTVSVKLVANPTDKLSR